MRWVVVFTTKRIAHVEAPTQDEARLRAWADFGGSSVDRVLTPVEYAIEQLMTPCAAPPPQNNDPDQGGS